MDKITYSDLKSGKRTDLKSVAGMLLLILVTVLTGCNKEGSEQSGSGAFSSGDAASKVYVAPGKLDEFYAFMSGGFSGQVSVYGLPSGRLLKVIPVFSLDAEKG